MLLEIPGLGVCLRVEGQGRDPPVSGGYPDVQHMIIRHLLKHRPRRQRGGQRLQSRPQGHLQAVRLERVGQLALHHPRAGAVVLLHAPVVGLYAILMTLAEAEEPARGIAKPVG